MVQMVRMSISTTALGKIVESRSNAPRQTSLSQVRTAPGHLPPRSTDSTPLAEMRNALYKPTTILLLLLLLLNATYGQKPTRSNAPPVKRPHPLLIELIVQ